MSALANPMFAATFVLAASLAGARSAYAAASQPRAQAAPIDWYTIERDIVDTLSRRDLGDVLRGLPSLESTTDPAALLRSLDLYTRAGRRASARAVIERLATVEPIATPLSSEVADFFIDREEWDLARVFLERFPDATPGWGYVFVKRWAERGDPREIDRWLDARSAGDRQYWFDERLRFRASLGTVKLLIDSLAVDVRTHPADVVKARRYVTAGANHAPTTPLDWIGDAATPALAFDAYELGELLRSSHAPRGAALQLARSLSLPYTAEDQRRLDARMRMRAAFIPPDPTSWEGSLRLSATIALIEAYTRSGQADLAQPLLEKVTALGANGAPPLGLSQLAGVVQRESGARVVEQRIAAAEEASKDSVAYWRSRAQYYTGRREKQQAVAAYERALALAAPDRTGSADKLMERYHIVGDFARLLDAPNESSPDGIAVIRREFLAVAPGSEYSSWLAGEIARRSKDNVNLVATLPDRSAEQRLWTYLAARPEWRQAELLLVRRLIEHLPASERAERVVRAQGLAANGDPSRASALADVLLGTDAPRAIALLQSYIERVPDGHDRDLARLRLFSAYLHHTADWKAAERAFPDARGLLTPRELSDHVGRVALMAARAGADDDAIRFWKMSANIDRTDLRHLPTIARESAMRARLVDYYTEVGRREPESWVPQAALTTLRAN